MNSAWSDPVLACAAAKALETRLFGGDEGREWTAMNRAGAAVARAVVEDCKEIGGFPAAGRLLVLAGKGHNGGDALLAARTMLERFPAAQAVVLFACGERTLRPLAWRAWRELQDSATGRVTKVTPEPGDPAWLMEYDLCLDGIFGFQFHPPVDAAVARVIHRVNAHPAIRLRAAVDLPSGLGGEAGAVTFRADFTYATGSVKAPVLAEQYRGAVGRLRYLDLGFFDEPAAAGAGFGAASLEPATDRVLKSSVLAPLAALRAPQSDKRTFGHLFVIGGSRNYPGAVLMGVWAALRSGVGLVTALVPESLVPAYASCAPEAIWVGWPETPEGGLALEGLALLRSRLGRATALMLGPGLGSERETLTLAEEIVKLADVPIVLDADALQPSVLAAARGRPVICLPHAGEYQRLAGGRDADAAGLRAVARETGATIILKGPVTRIVDGERIYHSFFGGPVLARGGSGDVLAGLVGGLVAQSVHEPVPAACRGVVWHGLAADLLARDRGQVSVQVTQLLDYLPAALRLASDAG
ncbi:MAG: NAD(P)H-hydrate dehydratase [Opitutaceae bacterium]